MAVAAKMKLWPQIRDLVTWWIFYNLDSEFDPTPEKIDEWYMDVYRNTDRHDEIHETLYREYEEFRNKFEEPRSKHA